MREVAVTSGGVRMGEQVGDTIHVCTWFLVSLKSESGRGLLSPLECELEEKSSAVA